MKIPKVYMAAIFSIGCFLLGMNIDMNIYVILIGIVLILALLIWVLIKKGIKYLVKEDVDPNDDS